MEAAKVPVEDQECQTRDSNISESIGNDLDYNNYCLECKYILYYWHLLFVSGLGQCYDTTNMYPKKRAFWVGTMINFHRPDHCHDCINWNKRSGVE